MGSRATGRDSIGVPRPCPIASRASAPAIVPARRT